MSEIDKDKVEEVRNINREELPVYKYPTEPSRFTGMDIAEFAKWSTSIGTSDITIQSDEQIVCEIYGRFFRVTNRRLSHSEVTEIVAKLYESDSAISRLNSGMDVDMAWTVKLNRDSNLRFRVNVTAILNTGVTGFQITIRTISSRAPLLENMGVPQHIVNNLSHKQGLIMVVGATGSGKSTFLASALDWRMRQPNAHIKILTYEAPIEYVYDDVPKPTASVAQTEIGKHLPSFAAGVRNALRRKPSVIVMGEMRDEETIGEGIVASMTGHLVYGTLHANGVPDCIRRMINVFPAGERNAKALDILSSLKMVIAQQLLKSTDGKRVAIREYLVFNEKIVDELIDAPLDQLTYTCRKVLLREGQTFLQDATDKFNQGLIDEHELETVRMSTQGSTKDLLNDNEDLDITDVMESGAQLSEKEIEQLKRQKERDRLELLRAEIEKKENRK